MKKMLLVLVWMLAGYTASYGCTTCNTEVRQAIAESTFYPNLFFMLSAFIVLGVLVVILSYLTARREKTRFGDSKMTIAPLISAATTIGIAIGGFIDGIVFHQILQWHAMLSNKIPLTTLLNKNVNVFWDGIFHLFCLIVALVGIYLLLQLFFRDNVIVTKKAFTGSLLLGWGIFNIVEGIIDHHLLRLHNVKEISENIVAWNYGFLGVSVVFCLLGYLIIKSGVPRHLYGES